MQVDTALQRIHSLETVLQLQPGQAKQIVLRLPKLLSYNPTVLQELVQLLMKLLGGNLEPARKLVLREPKVGEWCRDRRGSHYQAPQGQPTMFDIHIDMCLLSALPMRTPSEVKYWCSCRCCCC